MCDASYQALHQAADIIRQLRWTRTREDFVSATWMLTAITVLMIRCNEHDAAEQISAARISIPCVRTTGDDDWTDRLTQIARDLERETMPIPMGSGAEGLPLH